MKKGTKYTKLHNPVIHKLMELEMTTQEFADKLGIPRKTLITYINEFDSLPITKMRNLSASRRICKELKLNLKNYL